MVICTPEQKEQAVIDYCSGQKRLTDLAKTYEVSPNVILGWKKKLLGNGRTSMQQKTTVKDDKSENEKKLDEMLTEKEALEKKIEILEKDVYRLQLERDILEKAGEILKKRSGHQS